MGQYFHYTQGTSATHMIPVVILRSPFARLLYFSVFSHASARFSVFAIEIVRIKLYNIL